jgi:hypothetical protein
LSDDEWFWTPHPAVSHVAWQAGHIAMAQYGLTLFRQRGRAEIDAELFPSHVRKQFMKGTIPNADRTQYPSPEEIRKTMERIHDQMLSEIDGFDGDGLDQPTDPPFAGFANRYGALLFAGDHEMLHAGQIGFLRRLMGKDPIR